MKNVVRSIIRQIYRFAFHSFNVFLMLRHTKNCRLELLLAIIWCKLACTCEIHALGIRKAVLSFARNHANGAGYSDRSMIVINRRSLYNGQSKLRENFKLQYLQFLGLRAQQKSRRALKNCISRYENRVSRDAICVSREGGNFPLSSTVHIVRLHLYNKPSLLLLLLLLLLLH